MDMALRSNSNHPMVLHDPSRLLVATTVANERNRSIMDLGAGAIVWAIECLRFYLLSISFKIFSDHEALGRIASSGDNCLRIQRWLEFLVAYRYTLEYRSRTANCTADFLSHLPQEATEEDTSEACRRSHLGGVNVHFVGASGLCLRISRNPSGRIPILDGLLPVSQVLSWVGCIAMAL